jgi:hypothetical protein
VIIEVSPYNSVVLDSNGNGQCSLGPPSGTKWALRLGSGEVSTANVQPRLDFYRGSASGPIELIDSTFTGAQASSGKVGGAVYYAGQLLWAVWTGGDPGATATLRAFGRQGAKSDPLPDSPLGEGFANSSDIILGNTLQLGSPPQPYRVLTRTIPAELLAYGVAHNLTFYEVDLWYFDTAPTYMWDAMVTNLVGFPIRMNGTYDPVNGVFILSSTSVNGAGDINVNIGSFSNAFQGKTTVLNARTIYGIDSPFELLSTHPLGRGRVGRISSVANTAAIGAETVVLTTANISWKNGRAYAIEYDQLTTPSVANNAAQFRVRRNNVAGALLLDFTHQLPLVAAQTCHASGFVINNSGADISDKIVLTMTAAAGTCTGTGAATTVRWLNIFDVGGAVADFSNAIQI